MKPNSTVDNFRQFVKKSSLTYTGNWKQLKRKLDKDDLRKQSAVAAAVNQTQEQFKYVKSASSGLINPDVRAQPFTMSYLNNIQLTKMESDNINSDAIF
jgi:hypothetical protein